MHLSRGPIVFFSSLQNPSRVYNMFFVSCLIKEMPVKIRTLDANLLTDLDIACVVTSAQRYAAA